MLYTTYKKGIEEFDRKFKNVDFVEFDKSPWSRDIEKFYDKKVFKSFLKSLAIKSNEEEIEILKTKIMYDPWAYGYNMDMTNGNNNCIERQISHLETQNKLIEEDKNI